MPGETKKDAPSAKKVCLHYIASKLIVPYPPAAPDVDRTPYEMIAYWRNIWKYLVPTDTDRIHLRRLCLLFNDSLEPTPDNKKGRYTVYPHPNPNYTSLASLLARCYALYNEDPTRAPTILFIKQGDYEVLGNYLEINYPIKIFGAGRDKTIVRGGFRIEGTKEEGKKVVVSNMTIQGAKEVGLLGWKGLSFLCKDVTITQCGYHGVYAYTTQGQLLNCMITQCGRCGVCTSGTAKVEVQGDQTKVDDNCTSEKNNDYGLKTITSTSNIHLLFPLTKEYISTNNGGGGNYGSSSFDGGTDTIQTVDTFE
jgi:hypothetical protein